MNGHSNNTNTQQPTLEAQALIQNPGSRLQQTTLLQTTGKNMPGQQNMRSNTQDIFHDELMALQEKSPAYRVLHEHNLLTLKYRCKDVAHLDVIPSNSSQMANCTKRTGLCFAGFLPGVIDSIFNRHFDVPDGNVMFAKNDNDASFHFYGPGVHRHCNPFLNTHGVHALTEPLLRFGNRTIVTVPQGSVGYCSDRGQPVLLPPGLHQWQSDTLVFERNLDLSLHVIEMGPYTLLTVDEGYAAVTQDNGQQKILEGGQTYMLTHRNWRFEKFLTEKIQTNDLKQIRATTADNITLETSATVIWRIKNIADAALNAAETMHPSGRPVKGEDIAKLRTDVLQQAIASVSAFVGKIRYSEGEAASAAIDSRLRADSEKNGPTTQVTGVPVSEDQVMLQSRPKKVAMGGAGFLFDQSKIKNCVQHANGICDRYGVEILAINIISAFPTNEQLTRALAAGAIAAAEAEQAEVSAQGRAKALFIESNAEAEAVRIRARGTADAERTKAKGMRDAAATIEESVVAVNLQTIEKTGEAVGSNKTFFFGTDANQMGALLSNPGMVRT